MPFSLKFLGAVLPCCMPELNPEIFACESVATKHGFWDIYHGSPATEGEKGRAKKTLPGVLVTDNTGGFGCLQLAFLFSIKLESICG